MRVSKGEVVANYLVVGLFALFALAPILTIIRTALSARIGQPEGLHLDNFTEAWRIGNFGETMTNSLLVAVVVVAAALVLSVLAGYALGTMRFRGATVLLYLFLVGLMIPAEAIVIPLFFDLRTLGLTDTIAATALPQIAQSVAFGTFWMRAQFRSLHPSLLEAAALDGAGSWRALWSVLFPAARTAITTLLVLLFMWTWNEFLIALVMNPSGGFRTAPLGLANFQGQYTAENALLASAAIIVATPMLVLFLFMQRHFIRGMLEGAAKE